MANELQDYKNYMREEMSRPQIAADKEKFVYARFRQTPEQALVASLFLPVVLLSALFIFFLQVRPLPVRPEPAPAARAIQAEQEPETDLRDGIIVKRISSHVGPTLVYQREHEGVHMTIIWVFAGTKV